MTEYLQNPIPPERSLVKKAKTPGSHSSSFEVTDKVWMKDSNGFFVIMMYVTAKRNDAAQGWEYQLKDTNGIVYSDGIWMAEKDLIDA